MDRLRRQGIFNRKERKVRKKEIGFFGESCEASVFIAVKGGVLLVFFANFAFFAVKSFL
jgi:hypothetical protein